MNRRALSSVCLYIIEIYLFIFAAFVAVRIWQPTIPFQTFKALTFGSILFLGPLYLYKGLYSFSNWLIWDELRSIFRIIFTMLVVAMAVKIFIASHVRTRTIITMFTLFGAFDLSVRILFRSIPFIQRAIRRNVIIVGTPHRIKQLQNRFSQHRFISYHVMGYVTKEAQNAIGYTYLGAIAHIEEIIASFKERGIVLDEIVVASETNDELSRIREIDLDQMPPIKFVPPAYMMMNYSTTTQDLDGVILVSSGSLIAHPGIRAFKRVSDFVIALCALIVSLPLFLFCMLLIKRESNGPIFYTQKRIGYKGKHFKMYKFRTMYTDADTRLAELLASNREYEEEYKLYKKLTDDPRITRTGKILRDTSLDELPQLINILLGHMSLVGPRPYLAQEKEDMEKHYQTIIQAKPGLTGMWQVSGRSDIKFKSRLLLDVYYVHNYSLSMDIQLLLRTISVLISRKGSR